MDALYVANVDDNFVAKYVQNMMTIIMKIRYNYYAMNINHASIYTAKSSYVIQPFDMSLIYFV